MSRFAEWFRRIPATFLRRTLHPYLTKAEVRHKGNLSVISIREDTHLEVDAAMQPNFSAKWRLDCKEVNLITHTMTSSLALFPEEDCMKCTDGEVLPR